MPHNIKNPSNALITLAQTKEDCLKKLFKTVSEPHAGFLRSSSNEFQTVLPPIENTQRPYVLSYQRSYFRIHVIQCFHLKKYDFVICY